MLACTGPTFIVLSGQSAQLQYQVNVSGAGGASFYLYLDEDWQDAKGFTDCLHKLQMARIVRKYTVVLKFLHHHSMFVQNQRHMKELHRYYT